MRISLLQLNMNGDNYWETILAHLKTHAYDLIQLQEVTGPKTHVGNLQSNRNVFEALEKILSPTHKGELMITDTISSGENAYFGNAIFYKNDYTLLSKKLIYLKKNNHPFASTKKSYEQFGRGLLHLKLRSNRDTFSTMTMHGAWAKTPKEEAHQSKQSAILFNYLHSVDKPYILTGDFNLAPDQPTIKKLSLTHNSSTQFPSIKNTLNPRTHRARDLFPPGVVVDYIFTSKDMQLEKCVVLRNEDISDHFGLAAVITL